MDTSSQEKRKLSTPYVASKKQRRTSIVPKALKTNTNNNSNLTSRTTKSNGKRWQTHSPTLIQNNRELATALNQAKSRIRNLEDQKFQLQSDQHEFMEKYSVLSKQLQIMKDEYAAKEIIDNNIFKEICESLRSKMQKATKKLLESSVYLAEVDKSVATLLKMSASQNSEKQNCSVDVSSVPLEIECDDSMQRSQEAALSITKLTPSPSLASSSDSCEMTSPDPSDNSKLNSNQPGLLSTIEDHNSSFEKTDFRLVLNSTQNSLCESEILNASHESMDCHNISNDCIKDAHSLGSMNIDSPVHNSIQLSTTWDTTPDCSPIEYRRIAVGRLASTPEDCEISRFRSNLSSDSPQISPAFTMCPGRRMTRRRNMIDGFSGYKEPSISGKLRQGDPFTDCSLFVPSKHNVNKARKKTVKKKNNLKKSSR